MKTTLYKKDSSGKIRFVTVEANNGEILQDSGVLGSENIVKHVKAAKPKNVGRSNETTAIEQAVLEVEALVKDKLTKGYFLSVEETNELVILPMLAKDYFKEERKIVWGRDTVIVQPKLDGMRCLAFVKSNGEVKLLSRAGKVINNMFHIEKDLSQLGRDIILDGELYVHGEGFQTNMSYVKKYHPGKSERILFNVYDVVDFHKSYQDRLELFSEETTYVKKMRYDSVYNKDEIKSFFEQYVKEGYEGAMVKLSISGYKSNARSSELLKYKEFIDIQVPILDVTPSDARPTHGSPVFAWEGAKGHKLGDGIMGAGLKMSHEQREDLLLNKEQYIGKMAEIRFFEYSDDGIPRFPVMVGIRLDK